MQYGSGWDAMRAALYARVSTEDQAKEGFSLEAQLERLRSFCKARGWDIAGEFIDDGYSGRDDNRPAYRRMMGDRDRWDTILVMKMDRIHRNSRNFMEMMERLRSWGKEFTSMQESLDTSTAMGRFVMDIIQRIAQLESEQIAERVYTGMRQKAKSGQGSLGFPAPFGYRYEECRLAVHEEEAEIVREIFHRYIDGEPMAWIAEDLNGRGVATSRGGKWSVWSIRYLLQNPIYAGFLRWDGILQRGDHAAIVDSETFIRTLRAFHRRARSTQEALESIGRTLSSFEGVEAA
jgi:DNA invertase Pin-like site-specific DNA recombinase